MQVDIQPYTNLYQEQVIEFIFQILTQEFELPITPDSQPDLKQINNFYQTGNGNFWLALIDGHIVGTIALMDIDNQQVALRKMFVAKAFRGKKFGIAKKLLDTAITYCLEKSVREIYLGTTRFFLAAQRFYENNGFIEIPRQALPNSFIALPLDVRFYVYSVK